MQIREYSSIVLVTTLFCMWQAQAEEKIALNNLWETTLDLFLYVQGEEYPVGFRVESGKRQFASIGKPLSWVQVEAKTNPKFSSKGFVAGKPVKQISFRPGRIKITYADETSDDTPPQVF